MCASGQSTIRDCLIGDVELAVEAFAQHQKRDAVHMEIVAAAGAPAECDKGCGEDQKDKPDGEEGPHGAVGGPDCMGKPEGGDIHQHRAEKKQAPPPGRFHDTCVHRRINRTVSHAYPPDYDAVIL